MSLWKHPNVPATRVDAFRKYINRKYTLNIRNHQELHDWSVSGIETFAQEIWRFCGIVYSVPPTQTGLGLETMYPRPTWFPGARLNYTENLLKVGLAAHPDIIAVSACREGGTQWRDLTWQELRGEVEKWASALRRAGVSKGDRIATVMTNSLECLLVLLAAGAIGAVFSSTSPDMGSAGIVERYSQVKPKILFVETRVVYGGKVLDLRERLREAASKLYEHTDLQRTVIVNGPTFNGHYIQTADTFLQGTVYPLEFEQVPFDHPIYILYSSGTTGPPKCICHSGGGVLLQQKKEHIMSGNLGLDSCYYQYSTTGWMMWNYLVSGLSCGSRIILYDGNPTYPTPTTQLEILEQQGVTVWGTSPNFLEALRRHGVQQRPALENLEIVNSSGSPLTEELFHWFYDTFPHKTGLFSGSGGTDLAAGIIMGSPLLPIYPGEIATAALGMKVEIWDGEGRDITHTGEKGDLIITKPFFSMPTTFWGENGEEKYWKAYFEAFPGVWCHGDFVMKNPETGGYRILGRSDGVLNPGGVRFGTSELYGVVNRFSEVEDCIAVGQRKDGEADERILMFLKMKTGIHLNDSIRNQIRDAIRTSLSPRHVPAFFLEVDDIPYTLNGKKIENLVRDIVSSRKPKISGTVANPEALAQYYKFETIGRPQLERSKL